MAFQIDRCILGPIEANCYIVRPQGEKKALIIDPGDDYDTLKKALSDLQAEVGAIVVTHGHFDHLLSAAYLREDTGAEIYVSAEDATALTDARASLSPTGTITPFRKTDKVTLLPEGSFDICSLHFTVIKTPGHTRGGICLYNEDEKLIFTGDTLFDDSFGRTDLPGGDFQVLVQSLKMLLKLPGDTTVYSGHGDSALISDIRKVLCS